MDPQNDFFTLQSLATFAGAVGATTVIANGFQRAFHFNPAWLALLVAEVICISVVAISHDSPALGVIPPKSDYFVAVINGFLVFCSAGGATGVLNKTVGTETTTDAQGAVQRRGDGGMTADSHRSRRLLSPWF